MERVKLLGAITYTILVTLIFGTVCSLLYFREVLSTQKDLALVLFGALVVCFKDVGSYWTGSTASSATKDATIADIAKSKGTGP